MLGHIKYDNELFHVRLKRCYANGEMSVCWICSFLWFFSQHEKEKEEERLNAEMFACSYGEAIQKKYWLSVLVTHKLQLENYGEAKWNDEINEAIWPAASKVEQIVYYILWIIRKFLLRWSLFQCACAEPRPATRKWVPVDHIDFPKWNELISAFFSSCFSAFLLCSLACSHRKWIWLKSQSGPMAMMQQ